VTLTKVDVFVSVVVPMRDHDAIIEDVATEVHSILERSFTNFEIVLVDDTSRDATGGPAEAVLARLRCTRVIAISRDIGREIAIMAGLESAIGDFVATLEPGVDPPEMIPTMVEMARRGHDIVLGVADRTRGPGLVYRTLRAAFYRLWRRLMRVEPIPGATALRVLSRQAVNALTRVRQRRLYFPLLAREIGFGIALVDYARRSSRASAPSPGILSSIREGVSLIVHNSTIPLRLVSALGLIGSFLSLASSCYVVVVNIVLDRIIPGWTTLSLEASGLFFLVFAMLTLIGEYLGRLLDESTERPLYFVRGEKASSIMLSDPSRPNVLLSSVADRVESKQVLPTS